MPSSVIVNYLDVDNISANEPKANSPLIVDSNAPLTQALPCKRLKAIAWRNSQLVYSLDSVQNGKLSHGDRLNTAKSHGSSSFEECSSLPAVERFDRHRSK
jgi:hypothetical protein